MSQTIARIAPATLVGSDGQNEDTAKRGTKITAKAVLALLEKQGHRCALSGRPLTPETASGDHSDPLSRGGDNSMENLQIVHVEVNQAKGALTTEEFIQLCRDVASHCQG